MLSLQNRKTLFAALLICSILLTGWFVATALPFFAFIFAACSIALVIIFGRTTRLLQVVRLIRENRIPAVPAAWLQEKDFGHTCIEGIIVSTFGAIIGSRVVQWGQGGLAPVACWRSPSTENRSSSPLARKRRPQNWNCFMD